MAADATGTPTVMGVSLKYVSLAVLCIQNSTLAMLMRLSRMNMTEDTQYNTSTAVVTGEIMKVVTCVFLVLKSQRESGNAGALTGPQLVLKTASDREGMMQIAIPSVLYLIQNNLQYVAISNLEAATFQVLYQLKILTTAIFSVSLLGKRIIPYQWGAIVLLMFGVAMVQKPDSSSSSSSTTTNNMTGLICVLLSCTCSGFAGVYFEKILKNRNSKASIWERNIQMGLISGTFGIIGLLWSHFDFIMTKGFFFGYRPIVWAAISVNALGGLLTAVVVKYADNILKAFATSIAIVLSCITAFLLFGKVPTSNFAFGAILVNIAVYIYGVSPSWNNGSSNSKVASVGSTKDDDEAKVGLKAAHELSKRDSADDNT